MQDSWMPLDDSVPQSSEPSSLPPSNTPADKTPLPGNSESTRDALPRLSRALGLLERPSPTPSASNVTSNAASLIDQSKRLRELRVPAEEHQEKLAEFYKRITVDNPLWRAQEEAAANIGKLALEKIKIGARMNIEVKPPAPVRTIRIAHVFAD